MKLSDAQKHALRVLLVKEPSSYSYDRWNSLTETTLNGLRKHGLVVLIGGEGWRLTTTGREAAVAARDEKLAERRQLLAAEARRTTVGGLLDAAARGDLGNYIAERRTNGPDEGYSSAETVLRELHDRGLVIWDGALDEVKLTKKGRGHLKHKTPAGREGPKARKPVFVRVIGWSPVSGLNGARYWECSLSCGHDKTLRPRKDMYTKPSRSKCQTCTNEVGGGQTKP